MAQKKWEFFGKLHARRTQNAEIEIHIQNAYIESFNARLRDECLNQHWFISLQEAQTVIEEWREDYNRNRPHSSLGNQTPEEFAQRCALIPEAKKRLELSL